jgi:bacillaene synthase trans-acting acyltransferase
MSKVIWMFSGQGSQYFDMGRDLFDADSLFREAMQACDAHCRRLLGYSILEIVYPQQKTSEPRVFDHLPHTHPALFCIQYSLAQALLQRGLKPDMVLGYSLGELVALTVAGAVRFTEALELVVDQAEMLARSAPPGGMLAVMAGPEIFGSSMAFEGLSVAAYNFRKHFVLSGGRTEIERVQRHFQRLEVTVQRLPVNLGFHSPCMDVVEGPLRTMASRVRVRRPAFPVVSLAYGEILEDVPDAFLWKVVRQPVRFEETISRIECNGEFQFVDVGPAGTLATFLKYVLTREQHSHIFPILTPFRQSEENLRRVEWAL